MADAKQFRADAGFADKVLAPVDGRFMSALVRTRKRVPEQIVEYLDPLAN